MSHTLSIYYIHVVSILSKQDILHAATVLGQRPQPKRMADRGSGGEDSDRTTESQGICCHQHQGIFYHSPCPTAISAF